MVSLSNLFDEKTTEADVSQVEQSLKVKLPAEYREFLLSNNGAFVEPNVFEFDTEDGHNSSSLSWLYGLKNGDDDDVIEINRFREGRLPNRFLAIGTDPGGNAICISCKDDESFGKIYFWDHEKEADEDEGESPNSIGNTYLLAHSFLQFLNSLTESKGETSGKGEGSDGSRLKLLMEGKFRFDHKD